MWKLSLWKPWPRSLPGERWCIRQMGHSRLAVVSGATEQMMPAGLGTSACGREAPCPCSFKCWSEVPCAQSWSLRTVPLSSVSKSVSKESPESLEKKGKQEVFSHCGKFMAFWIWLVLLYFLWKPKPKFYSLEYQGQTLLRNWFCGMGGWGEFSSLWAMSVYIFNRNKANISVSSWTLWVCRKTFNTI